MPLEDYIEARLMWLEGEVQRLTQENKRLRESKTANFIFENPDMEGATYIVTFENGNIKIEKEEIKHVD